MRLFRRIKTLLASIPHPLNYFPFIRVGNRAISGRAMFNERLWDDGAIVYVWKSYFLVYEIKG